MRFTVKFTAVGAFVLCKSREKLLPSRAPRRWYNMLFYAFYAWWIYFPQSGALAEGTSLCHEHRGGLSLLSLTLVRLDRELFALVFVLECVAKINTP
jgi:hypothetical protein